VEALIANTAEARCGFTTYSEVNKEMKLFGNFWFVKEV
jgi:hypothetical protein